MKPHFSAATICAALLALPVLAHAASFEYRLPKPGLKVASTTGTPPVEEPQAPAPETPAPGPTPSNWVWGAAAGVSVSTDGLATVGHSVSALTTLPLPSSGKWYWEVTSVGSDDIYMSYPVYGVSTSATSYPGKYANNCGLFAYRDMNFVEDNGTERQVASSARVWTVGLAYDAATRVVSFHRGGTVVGSCAVGGSAAVYPSAGAGALSNPATFSLNASPSTVPTGYSALSTVPQN